jgi:UDP-4-amino-4,6-dideoxy-N-acetyl-beta-L-altrosamine transaminase
MLSKLKEQRGPNEAFLPYGRQVIDESDIVAVTEVLKSSFLTTGPRVSEFEAAFADYVGAKHCVVVSNGTAALHLAAMVLGISPGSQVIVPAITFMATANAVRYVGGDVVFADVDPSTGLMNLDNLKDAISRADPERLKAIFNVHLSGQTENLEEIESVATEKNLRLLDDACHAVGTKFIDSSGTPQKIGSNRFCDLSVFSFHPVKTIAMGEGGAITTNDAEIAKQLKRLRSHGITHEAEAFENKELAFDGDATNPWYQELQDLGFNYRATDIQCALGLSQLAKADQFVETRRALIASFDEKIKDLAPVIKPVKRLAPNLTGWHLNVALIDFKGLGLSRREVMIKLRQQGIGSQVHYIPVPKQPYYTNLYGSPPLPGAMGYYNQCLSLPLAADMTVDDMTRVASALRSL